MDAIDISPDPSMSPGSSGILHEVEMLEKPDLETLQLEHEQLKGKFWELKQNTENNLIPRVKDLEARELQITAQINFVKRYWTQFDEDVEILIKRYGTDFELEEEFQTERNTSLKSLGERELEIHLDECVQQSTTAVTKIADNLDDMKWKTESAAQNGQQTPEKLGKVNRRLENENGKIRALALELDDKWELANLSMKNLEDILRQANFTCEQLKDRLHSVEMKLPRLTSKFDKLASYALDLKQQYFHEHQEKFQDGGDIPCDFELESYHDQESDDTDFMDLAQMRQDKLHILQVEHRHTLYELENLKLEIRSLPETVIEETPAFQLLVEEFDAAAEKNAKLRLRMIEVKERTESLATKHMKKVDQIESEELLNQKQARNDLIQREDILGQITKAEQSFKVKVEILRAQAAEPGPIELMKEMRHFLEVFVSRQCRFKGGLRRFQKKCEDISAVMMKIQSLVEENRRGEGQFESPESGAWSEVEKEQESEVVQKLREQVKTEMDELREMRYLLDTCKAASNDTRDNEQLMESDRKLRQDLKCLREKLENDKAELSRLPEPGVEVEKRVNLLEAAVDEFRRLITSEKQYEEILHYEAEVNGHGEEDNRELKFRLQEQLQRKDEVTMRLLSDRMNTEELLRTGREKLNVLEAEISYRKNCLEEQRRRIHKMETDEMPMLEAIAAMKGLTLGRKQDSESLKVNALQMELDKSDLKSQVDASHALLEDLEKTAEAKTTALENARERNHHLREEIASYQRKVRDFNETRGIVDNAQNDEAMMEEIRLNKERLTCSCCKVNPVDALLTICFHVFCFDCLRTRYETRQRKCPTCNASFGANDYHRLHFN